MQQFADITTNTSNPIQAEFHCIEKLQPTFVGKQVLLLLRPLHTERLPLRMYRPLILLCTPNKSSKRELYADATSGEASSGNCGRRVTVAKQRNQNRNNSNSKIEP